MNTQTLRATTSLKSAVSTKLSQKQLNTAVLLSKGSHKTAAKSLKVSSSLSNRQSKLTKQNRSVRVEASHPSVYFAEGEEPPVCIITGASRGIGRAVALELAKYGCKIVVNDVSFASEFAEVTAEDIKAAGGDALIVYGDVSKEEDVEAMFAKVVDHWGKVDVMINNAGITRDGLMMRMKPDQWQAVINVNLNGVFLCTQGAMKVMSEQKHGRIINISSVSGLVGNAGQANYSAAKSAVIGITKTAALEMAPFGVQVNAVAPGFIESDMTAKLSQDVLDAVVEQVPLGRMGKVKEIAGAVRFLAIDEAASYISGHTIVSDGGLTTSSQGKGI